MSVTHSTLSGVIPRLRRGERLLDEEIDEIERVLVLLQEEGWSGFITADEALQAELSELEAAEARIDELTTTLVEAAIPLEALNADNYMGAKWMAPSIRDSVAAAVAAIRRLVGGAQPIG